MKILYISALSSPGVINELHKQTGRNPGFAMQKFNRMIATGFVRNGLSVKTLSGTPNISHNRKLIEHRELENVDGVQYSYIPFINLPVLRQLCLTLWSFFYVFLWGLKNRKEKRIVFDVLNISVCLGGLLASKVVGLKSCGIMTDMPGLMVGQTSSLKNRIITAINKSYMECFSCYVFLTEAMNRVINKKNKPYIIMEGLVDSESATDRSVSESEIGKYRSLMYAGGLFERYGIKLLIEAFLRLEDKNLTLDLYGHGPMAEQIKEYNQKDSRICFHGVVANEIIVEREQTATLLINPRPTFEDFTKYSFPSKNMEYMVSGTPVLTTKLPGMPNDYYPYIFTIEEETVEGFYQALVSVLSLTDAQLDEKGKKGREFVVQNKNNIVQSRRIIELLNSF